MARKFDELRNRMTPAAREKASKLAAQLRAEMPFHELRRARELTQEQLAGTLGINQAAVSKLEHRTDVYVSTLRQFVEAMGGSLEVRATFPEGDVVISNFSTEQPAPRHRSREQPAHI